MPADSDGIRARRLRISPVLARDRRTSVILKSGATYIVLCLAACDARSAPLIGIRERFGRERLRKERAGNDAGKQSREHALASACRCDRRDIAAEPGR